MLRKWCRYLTIAWLILILVVVFPVSTVMGALTDFTSSLIVATDIGDASEKIISDDTTINNDLIIARINVPTITTLPGTNVAMTTARLNARLDTDGGETCEVHFQYYTGAGAWTDNETPWIGGYTAGDLAFADIAGLAGGTLYKVRAQVRNSVGTGSGASVDVTTAAAVAVPTNFHAYPDVNEIVLTWTKGTGSTYTYIRFREEAYPTTVAQGTLIYLGMNESFTHTGLTSGHDYYYSAWGLSGGTYSGTYATAMATTLAGEDEASGPSAPPLPSTWFNITDYYKLRNMPGYSFINWVSDQFSDTPEIPGTGIPYATTWGFLIMIVCMGGGIATYAFSGRMEIAVIATTLLISLASIMELLPLWMMFMFIVMAIGIMMFARRG